MGGNSELLKAFPAIFPGTYVGSGPNNADVPVIDKNELETMIVYDAAGGMYHTCNTIEDLAVKNSATVVQFAKQPKVRIIVFAHDAGTPGAKYAQKTAGHTMPTPKDGVDVFFQQYQRDNTAVQQQLNSIGKAAVISHPPVCSFPIGPDFGRVVLSNRMMKEWIATYICMRVFALANIADNQTLFVMGPNFCKGRTGMRPINVPDQLKVAYKEAEYFCVYMSNVFADLYNVQIHSRDTDAVIASLVSWARVKTIVDQTEPFELEGVQFKNIVYTVQHWHEAKQNLAYIDQNKLWLALTQRMVSLGSLTGQHGIQSATATIVALLCFRGNDYVKAVPMLTPELLLTVFHQQYGRLNHPLVQEGRKASDFKMNCTGFLEFFLYAYAKKYDKLNLDMDDLESSFAKVAAALPRKEQKESFSYASMLGRCANVCWFMRYMLAAAMGGLPEPYDAVNAEGRSLWGYRRKSKELTIHGWEDVELTNDVDISHFDFTA